MKLPVSFLLVGMLFWAGCSREQAAKAPPPPKERVVTLEEIETTPEGLIRVKGESGVFSGRVVGRRPDGSREQELSIVNGLMHGTYVKWHLNGKKAEELTWTAGAPEGPARARTEATLRSVTPNCCLLSQLTSSNRLSSVARVSKSTSRTFSSRWSCESVAVANAPLRRRRTISSSGLSTAFSTHEVH